MSCIYMALLWGAGTEYLVVDLCGSPKESLESEKGGPWMAPCWRKLLLFSMSVVTCNWFYELLYKWLQSRTSLPGFQWTPWNSWCNWLIIVGWLSSFIMVMFFWTKYGNVYNSMEEQHSIHQRLLDPRLESTFFQFILTSVPHEFCTSRFCDI